jgi:hypothetical protein
MERERNGVARADLKAMVAEASRALALLNADRLEELAVSCRALSQDATGAEVEERIALAREALDAEGDLAVFGRVLEATHANLKVMRRLQELRAGAPGYGPREVCALKDREPGDGND